MLENDSISMQNNVKLFMLLKFIGHNIKFLDKRIFKGNVLLHLFFKILPP